MPVKAPSLQRTRKDLWLLRAVALVISILLWITVFGGKMSEATKKVTLDYQLPKNMVMANQVPHEITFRVQGPRAFLKDYQDRAISIPIDLTNNRPGEYEVIINEEMLGVPLGLKVVSISQSSVPIRLEHMGTKRVPVRAVFGGQLPEGLKINNITFKPSTVLVRGALSKLPSIDSVPTEPITLSPNSLRQELDVNVSLSDLPGIQVDDQGQTVHVSVELEGELSRRWVRKIPVGIRVGSGPNAKFVDVDQLGIRVKPESVSFLLEGVDKIVQGLRPSELEVWAEIPRLKGGTYKARLDWKLPPEIRVVRRSSDYVDVVVPPM
jgi:YbbR domain-containing protein